MTPPNKKMSLIDSNAYFSMNDFGWKIWKKMVVKGQAKEII